MSKIDPKRAHRLRDPETNPCLKETDMTTKCLQQNHYVRDMCGLAFKNYTNCRSFWSEIMKQRQKARIKPHMPGEKERERIKAERAQGKNVISAPNDS